MQEIWNTHFEIVDNILDNTTRVQNQLASIFSLTPGLVQPKWSNKFSGTTFAELQIDLKHTVKRLGLQYC